GAVRVFGDVVVQGLVERIAGRVVRVGEPERSPAPAELACERVDASRIGANEVPRHDPTGDADHARVGQAARVRRAVDSVAARAAAVAEQRTARLLLRSLLRAARGVGAQVGSEEILAVEELLAARGLGVVDVLGARRIARARERRRLDRLDARAEVLEAATLLLDPGSGAGRDLGTRA